LNILTEFLFSFQLSVISSTLPIAVFGFASLGAAFLMTFLPETKGRPMPQTISDSEDMWSGDTLWSQAGAWMCKRSKKHGYENI